jgi:hypothetical protein
MGSYILRGDYVGVLGREFYRMEESEMNDIERAKDDIERARKLYHLKDELQGMADLIRDNDIMQYGPDTGNYRTDFMLKVCEIMDLLIPEATKVIRTVK